MTKARPRFVPGQKVLCLVKAQQWNGNGVPYIGRKVPDKDQTYTVRQVVRRGEDYYLLLKEIVNPPVLIDVWRPNGGQIEEGWYNGAFISYPTINQVKKLKKFLDMPPPKDLQEEM